MAAKWLDMHCHLDKLEEGVEAALEAAWAAGLESVVTIGTEPADHPVVLELSRKYYPKVYCTLGVHPHEGVIYTDQVGAWIEQNLSDPGVIAVGEIGLDYYYNHSEKDQQIEAFRKQMEIAKKHQLPVEIHTRDAEQDTVEILKEYKGQVNGLIHCFTGTQWLADQALDLGYNISISGVVTFKNAESLRDTVRRIPLDRIHVETDAPFLAPIPKRGQKNTPAFVVHTARVVSELLQVTEEQLAVATGQNARKLFKKIKA